MRLLFTLLVIAAVSVAAGAPTSVRARETHPPGKYHPLPVASVDLALSTGPPVLIPAALYPGDSVAVSGFTVRNQYTPNSAYSFRCGYYLSADTVITVGADSLLGWVWLPALGPYDSTSAPDTVLAIPEETVGGQYYLGIYVDDTGENVDPDPTNNWASSPLQVQGGIWHVPSEVATIQAALDSAAVGDTVEVACGTYQEYEIVMKSGVVLRSETGEPDCVTIDATNDTKGGGFQCINSSPTTVIEGFTLINGDRTYNSGNLYGNGASFTVRNCVFRDNWCGLYGGAVFCENGGSVVLEDCVFWGNHADNSGAAIASSGVVMTVRRCTIVDNTMGNSYHWAIETNGGGITLENTIVAFNAGYAFAGFSSPSVSVSCCDVFGNYRGPGDLGGHIGVNGNVAENPLFCDRAAHDYHIAEESRCAPGNSPGCGLMGGLETACALGFEVVIHGAGVDTLGFGRADTLIVSLLDSLGRKTIGEAGNLTLGSLNGLCAPGGPSVELPDSTYAMPFSTLWTAGPDLVIVSYLAPVIADTLTLEVLQDIDVVIHNASPDTVGIAQTETLEVSILNSYGERMSGEAGFLSVTALAGLATPAGPATETGDSTYLLPFSAGLEKGTDHLVVSYRNPGIADTLDLEVVDAAVTVDVSCSPGPAVSLGESLVLRVTIRDVLGRPLADYGLPLELTSLMGATIGPLSLQPDTTYEALYTPHAPGVDLVTVVDPESIECPRDSVQIAVTLYAGAGIFLRFDNGSNYIQPSPFSMFTATIYVSNVSAYDGMTSINFKLNRTFDGTMVAYESLLGGPAIGDPESGWALAAPTCLSPPGPMAVGYVQYVYLGWPGTLEIVPHDTQGATIGDCSFGEYVWCVDRRGHGGVGMPPPRGDCFVVGIDDGSELPAASRLHPCVPNPFRGTLNIRYDLAEKAAVEVAVYDLAGRLVRRLESASGKDPGRYELSWDGRDAAGRRLSAGVYFYNLRAGSYAKTRKVVLLP